MNTYAVCMNTYEHLKKKSGRKMIQISLGRQIQIRGEKTSQKKVYIVKKIHFVCV
jgi:hypothetical protein